MPLPASSSQDLALSNGYRDALIDYLLNVDSPEAMNEALERLLTPAEYQEISKRLQIFNLLRDGVPHRQIAQMLGVGIATVSRGSRALGTSHSTLDR
ncbi:TrpR family trp operon transcriptional repressor [Vreelandella songnenensis]|uniref:TrpR family trp operon transcriptional repressor n=1 Tax=Vreelandella songnenensis TaxID=1176243 RepID=A0A2T0V773_9GAMM|nr:Trp family transcriptional regulator [Halomonas songnenensis]PRY66026.1 TrpR family trp operon transcriptional repressor [Halomonas songnenensis]